MKVSDYIAELISKYTDCVFSGQGGTVVHLIDSISKTKGLKLIPCETEQGAAIASDGYARISKKLGVTVSTTAPGFANAFQGIQCSYFDNIPTLHIVGVPVVKHLKSTYGLNVKQLGFQELDIVACSRQITKYAVRITDVNNIRYEMERLIHLAFDGRKGAVLVEIPDDIQRAEICPKKLAGYNTELKDNKEYNIDWNFINEAIEKSRKPLIIFGGGIKNSNTEEKAISFIENTGIPFLTSWACKDLFPYSHSGNFGVFGVSSTIFGNKIVQKADLLIVLGCKLDTHMAGSNYKDFAKAAKTIIMVDIDSNEMDKFEWKDKEFLKIECDLNYFFDNLKIIEKRYIAHWIYEASEIIEKYPICKPEYYNQKEFVNPYVFFEILSDFIDNDIIVTDAGSTVTQTFQGLQMNGEAKLFTSYNISPMGYALPAAIGAYFADSSKQVICIVGDGGIRMNIQELSLIKYHNIPLKIFVMDNGGYNIIRQTQDTWLNGRHFGTDSECGLPMPDIRKIAEAYGIDTMEVRYNENLLEIFNKIIIESADNSILCLVKINPEQKIIPKLKFGQSLEEID